MDYSALQNGSDIRGVAIAVEGGKSVNLTEQACRDIGRGFALWLYRRYGRPCRVALGRDCRLSGEQLLHTLGQALAAEGMSVTDMGQATTPAMFMTTVTEGWKFDASVMATASHLPMERNGFKFFTAEGGLESSDVKEILALAASDAHTQLAPARTERGEFMDVYAAQLREKLVSWTGKEKPFAGLRIVVDAGNGMGGFYASEVLEPLGADTRGSRYLEPDGSFPNHIPNPEDQTAMESIREAVLQSGAAMGVIFDTDVDRAGAVLSDGTELNRNRIIAALAAILLSEHPGTTIVTDSITSTGLAAFIRRRGGVHRRFKRGYRNVINEGLRLNAQGQDCQMAMETSGHGALKENYFLDDGAYLMTRLLAELVKRGSLESLLTGLAEPVEAMEFRMNVSAPDFAAYGQQVLDELGEYAKTAPGWRPETENYEGVRVNVGSGWFLLRLSLHDPLLPLNIESDAARGVREIARELLPFLQRFEKLDSSALAKYAEAE
ncbi:MAG: phosphomannomutase/phosphoglucomutase [Clostridiales bacterium]|nr:phosphomannomutase/phosphoglucomutase [Candidatus Apopatocola equi]